ncbi:MAG TPA: hypothetical protein VN229_17080 [Terriglobales bacterium]|nr:hypothetical protein [Terriglobales bacterium]
MAFDTAGAATANANDDPADDSVGKQSDAHAVMEDLRAALGVVPVAPPATYRIYMDDTGGWQSQREGDATACSHADRDAALMAARLAVIRCTAYRLFLQDMMGRVVCESYNWPSTASPSHASKAAG